MSVQVHYVTRFLRTWGVPASSMALGPVRVAYAEAEERPVVIRIHAEDGDDATQSVLVVAVRVALEFSPWSYAQTGDGGDGVHALRLAVREGAPPVLRLSWRAAFERVRNGWFSTLPAPTRKALVAHGYVKDGDLTTLGKLAEGAVSRRWRYGGR